MRNILLTLVAAALLTVSSPAARAITVQEVQQRVGLDQHLGRTVPAGITLIDERGRHQRVTALLNGKPAVLAMVYFQCPNLCTLTLNGLADSVRRLSLKPGRDFEILAVSIDPRETPALAASKRATYLSHYGLPAAADEDGGGWHFLTGEGSQITSLAGALGLRYFWDAAHNQYAHPAGLVILTSTGRIAQYLNGVSFPVTELRRALQLAAHDQTGSLAERLWLLCYHYDALFGRYSSQITVALRVFGIAVVLSLAALIIRLIRTSP
jgi:protein SCO1